ncbi:MAG: SGNH/GDSL hydrolase family protein [Rhodococcus sp. (in: high G+C Gram-positive bacteria)]
MRRSMVGVLAVALFAVSAVAGCAADTEPESAAAPPPLDYVALGDSAASGPLIPRSTGTPGCLQSDANYPHVLAGLVGAASFVDVSCSGARTENIAERAQSTNSGPIPLQIDALTPETDLVTITIGGNDVDLVSRARGCVNFSPEPEGSSCAEALTAGGTDVIAESIDASAPRWGEALGDIADRAPNAEIVVVGYGTYVRPGGCYGTQPVWARDADYLQSSVDRMNDALAEQAEQRGARFVDVAEISVGHDACAVPAERYLEGVVPANPAAPLHPTAAGMAAFAQEIATALSVG